MALEDISGSLSATLRRAIVDTRTQLNDPLGRVAVVCISLTTAVQLTRDLGCGPGLLNVAFVTPGQVVSAMGQPALAGRTPEPAGWLTALLSASLPELELGRYAETLRQPGWREPLASALRELDAAGVTDEDLLAASGDDPDRQERCRILLTLRSAVRAARADESRYTQRELELAALARARSGLPHPYADVQAAILVGDAMLSTAAHDAMAAWLAGRTTLRLSLPPLDTLPAPSGLWLAAPDAPLIPASLPQTGLGHLRRRAFQPPTQPGPDDDTVVFAATPDEVREIDAAVEEAMAAIRAGTPLEQIAIVLPDPAQAGALSDTLDRAGIPATWLTAEPLRQTLPAGFLLLALQLAEGGASPQRWHQLLTHPGLQGIQRTGRLRWRRLLGALPPSPSADRTDALLASLRATAAAAEPAEDGSNRERDAAETLAGNIARLREALAALPRVGTLAEHGAAWAALLSTFYRRSREQARLLQLLRGWGGGARLGRSAAAALLEEQLRSVPNLRGSMTQRAIHVLPPMLALGGDYALICLTGVVDGRMPRKVEESGLLNAPLRDALRAQGCPIVTREEREAVEQRRLAAVLAGCRGRLWVSSPQTELLKARPTLPGSLLLQLASTLAGRRLSLRALRARMVRCGQRSAPVPAPGRALGAAGSRLSRAAHAPSANLDDLFRHPGMRRLAAMHRDIDRLLYADGPPTARTGLVDPAQLPAPALSGAPQHPRALADLVHAPSTYFLQELLGSRPPARLGTGSLSPADVRRAVLAVLAQSGEGQFAHAWNTQVEAWGTQAQLSSDAKAALRARGLRHVEALRRSGVAGGLPLPAVEGASVGPFTVATDGALQQGDAMLYRRSHVSSGTLKASDAAGFRLLAEAFALQAAGHPIQKVRRVGLNGTRRDDDLARHRVDFQETALAAADRAAAGFWPTTTGNRDRLAFARERTDGPRLSPEVLLARLPGDAS